MTDNVIYVDFKKNKKKSKPKKAQQVTGVFIKPCGADFTVFALSGNVAGFIANYIAFNPEFSPSLFGKQVREEMGIALSNDNPEPEPTNPKPTKKRAA
jgi:hypothetical protein